MARTRPLMIQIATGDTRPIVRQIVDAVRMQIATGELQAGDQLPSGWTWPAFTAAAIRSTSADSASMVSRRIARRVT